MSKNYAEGNSPLDVVGEILDTTSYGKYKVLSIDRIDKHHIKWYCIRFIDTGFETVKSWSSMKLGTIKDYLKPNSVFGVGHMGAKYSPETVKKEMDIWRGMMGRCYGAHNASYHNYGGRGVTVCDRWLVFSNFLEDLPKVEGYNKELFDAGLINLDKDLKQKRVDNKVYSLDTCSFLTRSENSELAMEDSMRRNVRGYNPKYGVIDIDNCNQFSKEYDVAISALYMVLDGKINGTNGWTFTQDPNESNTALENRWEKYFKQSRKRVKIDNVVYFSISEASRNTGKNRKHINKMVEMGMAEYIV